MVFIINCLFFNGLNIIAAYLKVNINDCCTSSDKLFWEFRKSTALYKKQNNLYKAR